MTDNTALFRQWAPKLMAKLMADFAFSVEDAAAIMGNAGHESGGFRLMQELRPTAGRGGLGIFQWTGPRRREYEAWLARKSAKPTDFDQSYAFLYRELISTERRAVAATKAAVGLYNKVVAFERAFERAGVKHYDSRFKWAQIALAAYQATPVTALPTARPLEVPTMPTVAVTPAPLPNAVSKPWYMSKGVIGGIIATVLPIASVALPALRLIDPNTATEVTMQIMGAVGGVIAIIGRFGAKQPVSGSQAAAEVQGQHDAAALVAAQPFVPDTLGTEPDGGTHLKDISIEKLARELPETVDQLLSLVQTAAPIAAIFGGTKVGGMVSGLADLARQVEANKAAARVEPS